MRNAILTLVAATALLLAVGCGSSDDGSNTVGDAGGTGGGGDAAVTTDTGGGGGGGTDGKLGGPCYANDTCDAGLVCDGGTCKADGGGGTEGALNGPCYPNATCNAGLVCQDGTCVAPDNVGMLGGPCFGNGTCNEGLVCVDGLCQEPGGEGELGGACYPNGSCNAGLVCVDGVCREPAPGSYAWEHPCQPGGPKVDGETCTDHCECESGYCYDEGYLNGFRFCTRRCDGFQYECPSAGGVETYVCTNFSGNWVDELDPPVHLKNFCLKRCQNDAECEALDPAWDGCVAQWTEWAGHTIALPRTCVVYNN